MNKKFRRLETVLILSTICGFASIIAFFIMAGIIVCHKFLGWPLGIAMISIFVGLIFWTKRHEMLYDKPELKKESRFK